MHFFVLNNYFIAELLSDGAKIVFSDITSK